MLGSRLGSLEDNLSRIFKAFVFLVAAIYFLVDAVFFTLAKPVVRRLADYWAFESVRTWIVSLRPYPTLALFLVPVVVLEPVKPVAACLTATGHIIGGLTVLAVGELVKLLIIERLFRLSRDKLLSIPVFAWCYETFCQSQDWVTSLQAWQLVRRLSLTAKHAIQRYSYHFRHISRRKMERKLYAPFGDRRFGARPTLASFGWAGTALMAVTVVALIWSSIG
jgi:hypothetical protein